MGTYSVYSNDDADGLWLARRDAHGTAVCRIGPGDLVGMDWAELRRLPPGAELEIEAPAIDWRSMSMAAPPRVVRATKPVSEPARPGEAQAPQASKEPAPQPTARPIDAVEAMRKHVAARGLSPRAEAEIEARPGEPAIATAMRRRLARNA